LLVFAGFSQGVAMAYRAALRGARPAATVLAVGGDVPPELDARAERPWPRVLVVAGTEDTFYTPSRLAADLERLRALGADARSVAFAGGHEWSAVVDEIAGEWLASEAARAPEPGTRRDGPGTTR